MKRLLFALPFLLAACEVSTVLPTAMSPSATISASSAKNTCTLINGNVVATGFDEFGYNRCARNFNGTFGGWCAKMGQAPDCAGVLGSTKLIMKWNAGWDLGNFEGWTSASYDAWLDNEIRGNYLDGTPFSEHFKTHWDAGCTASGGVTSSNGGTCIWGLFEVLMDQGTEGGVHTWWAKLSPAGFGS